MHKQAPRKAKPDWKKLTVSGIALLLVVVLIAGLISMIVNVA